MRLEIEPTVAAPLSTDDIRNDDVTAAELKSMLNQGIKAAQAGNRSLARISLQRATELDPKCESAWLWLASISEYPEELLGFLNHVLEINPENKRALEWKAATNALLAKTFVQRGVDACDENQKDFAAECFQTALQYDDRNATAYMWMAVLAESNAVKVSLLQRSLECDPTNVDAQNALEAALAKIVKDRLTDAKTAVVAGNNAEAINILNSLLSLNPSSIEAWTLKSHLAEGFDEKIRCFESILAIDPENIAARAGRESLLSIFGTMKASEPDETRVGEFSQAEETQVKFAEADDELVEAVSMEAFVEEVSKSPTEDLEMPEYFSPGTYGLSQTSHLALSDDDSPSQSEEDNNAYQIKPTAEPFATLATETPEPQTDNFEAVNNFTQLATEDSHPDQTAPEAVAADFEHDAASPTDPVTANIDPQSETVAFSYEDLATEFVLPAENDPTPGSGEFVIPMPAADLPEQTEMRTGYETTIAPVEMLEVAPESFDCAFCGTTNEPQSISCHSCLAVLTLSDLELLLANQNADKVILRRAVEEMEHQRATREFNGDEMITLGIGHLNLRNLQLGYSCLLEASRIQPDNVVLSGQVNSLLIRLDEIRQQEEAHMRMPKGKSILVVDDSPTVRKLISGKLEKSGHEVVCAIDGVEAMERLEDFVPDLILLDITMPRMDGYQVCKNIRSKSSTKEVPVVMISGKDGFFDKVRGRMAGTTGYITKPFGPETLMKAVEMYLAGEAPDLDEV